MQTVWRMEAEEDDGKKVYATLAPVGLAGWRMEFSIDSDRGRLPIGHKVGADRLALMVAAEGLAEQMLSTPEIWRLEPRPPQITEYSVVMRGAHDGEAATLSVKRWARRWEATLRMDEENYSTMEMVPTKNNERCWLYGEEDFAEWVRLVFDLCDGLEFDFPPDTFRSPLDEIDDFM